MANLFQMITGTNTGSILAAAISAPLVKGSNEPRFYASDIIDLYQDQGTTIFSKNEFNTPLLVLIVLLSALAGGMIGFKMGAKYFSDPEVEETHEALRDYIRKVKSGAKKKQLDSKV
jgi:hypothetical protein